MGPLSHSAALSVLADRLGELDIGLQEELAHSGVLAVRLDREAEIWLGVDQRSFPSRSSTSFKVLVVMEPPDVRQPCVDGFDLVLTWHAEHLQALPSACLFVPAAPWLLPSEWPQFHGAAKRPCLGFLRGSKRMAVGHKLRHEVWDARERLQAAMQIPIDFAAGGGLSRDERNRQFTCKFLLVIENSQHANYFTEKLLDAMLSRCVPIYWGCVNLGDFFDVAGVVVVQGGLEEVIDACGQLCQDDYDARADAVDRNFELARRYAGDFGQRLQRALEERLLDESTKGNSDAA